MAMATAQRNDGEMAAYHTATSGLLLQDVQFGPTDTTLLCDISSGQPRPVVPAAFRRTVFDVLHGLRTPPSEPHKNYFPTDMFGMAFASKLVVGKGPVNLARRPRFSDISGPWCKLSMCHTGDSTTRI